MMLDQTIVIGLLLVFVIVAIPLYILLGIMIIGNVLEDKENREEYERNQSKNK